MAYIFSASSHENSWQVTCYYVKERRVENHSMCDTYAQSGGEGALLWSIMDGPVGIVVVQCLESLCVPSICCSSPYCATLQLIQYLGHDYHRIGDSEYCMLALSCAIITSHSLQS